MATVLDEPWLLGVVHGAAEVFPISSLGHATLLRMLFSGRVDAASAAFFHAGTLAAALVTLRKRALAAGTEGVRNVLRPALLAETRGGRDAKAVAIATVATGIAALALEEPAAVWSSSPSFLGLCFLVSALAIGSTRWAPKGDEETPSPWGAALAGVAQGAAVLPGLSRTATTVAVLLWLGVRSERAFELSFLMALPALAWMAVRAAPSALGGSNGPAMLVGAIASFVVGLGALRVLRGMVERRNVALFAIYLVPLGVATLGFAYAKP